MIKVNLANSELSKKELDSVLSEIKAVHSTLENKAGKGAEFTDWLTYAKDISSKELKDIDNKVKELKKGLGVEKLVVIGIGGSYLGGKAAIDFVKGSIDSFNDVIFAGINMSPSHYAQVERWLGDSKWAICVISKSGTTLEPALAFRHFKKLLINKVGLQQHSKYVVAVTDASKGALKTLSDKEGYTTYTIPDGIGGRFSGITPVGLFPMAFAGIDIQKFMSGVKSGMKDNNAGSLSNQAYLYAAARTLLYRGTGTAEKPEGLPVEIFTSYDPDLNYMGEWWKQLFGESEGKGNRGIFPASVNFSADLHSLGQYIQEGTRKQIFSTTVWVKDEGTNFKVGKDAGDLDGLNYLAGTDLQSINKKAFEGVVEAHAQGGNPQIIIEIPNKSEQTLGELWFFYFRAVSMSAYMSKVNPYDQTGVELYKQLMFRNLKK